MFFLFCTFEGIETNKYVEYDTCHSRHQPRLRASFRSTNPYGKEEFEEKC